MKDIMNSIYDELDNLDLDNLFKDEKSEEAKKEEIKKEEAKKEDAKANVKTIKPEDCLYDKTYTCPVCDSTFKAKTVRKGKAKFINNDVDLKPNYEPIQPDYYDVIICDKCGYAAISQKFPYISSSQAKSIMENISLKFIPKEYPTVYDVNIAIERYKLALLSCVHKKAKSGEKAFICLKLAWAYRDKKDNANEVAYLKSAYNGFNDAFTKETLPICGLDENTLLYILAAISARLANYDEALKILGKLIVKKNLGSRLKERAEDLKDLVKSKN